MTSIGSSTSFWQQDQQFWSQSKAETQTLADNTTLINLMANAQANLTTGLASLANQAALKRVNNQISQIVQQTLNSANGTSGTASSPGSSTSSSSSSSSATKTSAKPTLSPATLTGKVILTPGTSLSSLGILSDGTITVSASTNATTYTSTGTDTIGDLISAINVDLPTNAQVTASLSSGHLVITSRNNKDSIAVVGSGTDPAAIGFGTKNSSAQPSAPKSTTTGTATGSAASTSSTGTGSSATSSANLAAEYSKSLAQQNLTSAQGILTGTGVSGTLLNMLT